jgi:surface antigen
MRGPFCILAAAVVFACPGTAWADASGDFSPAERAESNRELPAYLQCVPYARERSGVKIYGDARTWWDQAAGRYKRGSRPKPGAVMTFRPYGGMTLGHVAAVAKVIDSRTVLLDHANWSPIDGRRGQIERGVKAVDVSPANDWSQVRVWYDPLGDLGTTAWPVAGFIYNERDDGQPFGGARVLASASYTAPAPAVSPKPSKRFADAFSGLGEPAVRAAQPVRSAAVSPVRRVAAAAPAPRDPIAQALARYDR